MASTEIHLGTILKHFKNPMSSPASMWLLAVIMFSNPFSCSVSLRKNWERGVHRAEKNEQIIEDQIALNQISFWT
jgi:hypothetical protein